MKGIFTVLGVLFLFSCKESSVQLAKPSTFVHYYNGGFNDDAQSIIETSDKGFLILANTNTSKVATAKFYHIKLIKTDAYGNQQWQKLFPDPLKGGPDEAADTVSYQGFGLAAIQDNSGQDTGYVITGNKINKATNLPELLMITVKSNGDFDNSNVNDLVNVQGMGVAWSKTSGDFFVVGQIQVPSDSVNKNTMYFARLDKTSLGIVWSKMFGDGKSILANRLFLDYTEQSAYWGGTVSYDGGANLPRYVRSGFQSSTVGFNLTLGNSLNYSLTGSDLCQYGFDYAFVGGFSASSSSPYSAITYTRVSADGVVLGSQNFKLYRDLADTLAATNPAKASTQSIQPANAICSTQDGGLLLLGTIALDDQGTNTDYYLIKIDVFGKKSWIRQHGGKFVDTGVKVLQASDGGYVILGTTNLANVHSILLMKTDLQGNIE